jgi:hypothetical protein
MRRASPPVSYLVINFDFPGRQSSVHRRLGEMSQAVLFALGTRSVSHRQRASRLILETFLVLPSSLGPSGPRLFPPFLRSRCGCRSGTDCARGSFPCARRAGRRGKLAGAGGFQGEATAPCPFRGPRRRHRLCPDFPRLAGDLPICPKASPAAPLAAATCGDEILAFLGLPGRRWARWACWACWASWKTAAEITRCSRAAQWRGSAVAKPDVLHRSGPLAAACACRPVARRSRPASNLCNLATDPDPKESPAAKHLGMHRWIGPTMGDAECPLPIGPSWTCLILDCPRLTACQTTNRETASFMEPDRNRPALAAYRIPPAVLRPKHKTASGMLIVLISFPGSASEPRAACVPRQVNELTRPVLARL